MSKYLTLANEIINFMHLNENPLEEKLPTEAELAATYQVSRQTVRNALSYLRDLGLIQSRQGSGYYTTGLSLSQDRNFVPVLLPSIYEYIYPEIWYHIKEQLTEQGYDTRAFITQDSVTEERRILLELIEHAPRCMIVEGCKSALPNPNLDLYQQLESKGTFFIFLHNIYPGIKAGICIKDDNYYGGYLLGEHLIDHGHKKIAGIFQSDSLQGIERYYGFMCCMRDHGIMQEEHMIHWFRSDDVNHLRNKKHAEFLSAFLESVSQEQTAILCYNDEIAYHVVQLLMKARIELPLEKSIVSFDNSYLCELSRIPLTSIAHEKNEIAGRAVQSAIQKLKGLPVSSQEIPWKLFERKSVTSLHPYDIL